MDLLKKKTICIDCGDKFMPILSHHNRCPNCRKIVFEEEGIFDDLVKNKSPCLGDMKGYESFKPKKTLITSISNSIKDFKELRELNKSLRKYESSKKYPCTKKRKKGCFDSLY